MKTLLYIRGKPGTGKHTVSKIIANYLKWPVLWVHDFDAVYRAIGEHRDPYLTDDLMNAVAKRVMTSGRDFMIVRPSRDWVSVSEVEREAVYREYRMVVVRLTADYGTLQERIAARVVGGDSSPFRVSTKAALDEYLSARPDTDYPGECVIPTDGIGPEIVARRIVELVS